MRFTLWGTRGSLASPGPDTVRYGGNTSCIEVRNADGRILVLDAGTGIRRLRPELPAGVRRIDVLLTHLHMDHIQGLGFFDALYDSELEVHVWGPASSTTDLYTRLTRYLSPPLFPVRLRDLDCALYVHDVEPDGLDVPGFSITAARVVHPGPTVGYRIEADGGTLTYLSDHEPMLCARGFALGSQWISGAALAAGVDVLVHDAQFTPEEYETRVGWGHSTLEHAARFAAAVGARRLVPFHHDPGHEDALLDTLIEALPASVLGSCELTPVHEAETRTV